MKAILFALLTLSYCSTAMMLGGGYSDAVLNAHHSELVFNALGDADEDLGDISDDGHPIRSVNRGITSVQTQIVAGTNYKIKFIRGYTACAVEDFSSCPDIKTEECEIVVWEKVWMNFTSVTDFNCPPKTSGSPQNRMKRGLKSTNEGPADKLVPELRLLGGPSRDGEVLMMFADFMAKHKKVYKDETEQARRFAVFKVNMATAEKLQQADQGTARYGASPFADWTTNEFACTLRPRVWDIKSKDDRLLKAEIPQISLADSYDWRSYNVVTAVKNQGACGSCWAFSAVGNIEGQNALKHKRLYSLSEQELVDCDKEDNGCYGGLPTNAYHAIQTIGGLESESAYPYEAEKEDCHFEANKTRVKVRGGLNISSDETEMAKWLVANGPISVGLNANMMQFYMGGVSHPWKMFCNPDSLDHGVLIVGYGVEKSWLGNDSPYWLIKNSWGTYWGEQGYYKLYRGDGTCGINQMPTSAIVA